VASKELVMVLGEKENGKGIGSTVRIMKEMDRW